MTHKPFPAIATAYMAIELLMLSQLCWGQVAIEELPRFPAPPHTISSWVAKDIVVNNSPMSIKEFNYPGSAEQFEEFYKQQWPGPFFNKSRLGDETLLGYVKKPYYYSLRYKSRFGQLTGQMIVSKVDAKSNRGLRTELPLPLGSTIRQVILAKDRNIYSESITVNNRLSINGNARFMISELQLQGWRPDDNTITRQQLNKNDNVQLELSRPPSRIQITLSKQPNPSELTTQMLIHWIK
ncbi:MAG: hypothetical protein COB04_13015 [Gammaproteobacteria bacterium]|nr:MAG: hypothetical protein COB04_13015 [Gammaproteobacteria bacterium]